MRWNPYAMVRVAAFFVAGILVYRFSPDFPGSAGLTVFLIILLPVYLTAWILLEKSNALKFTSGIIGLVAVFLAGYLNASLGSHANRDDHVLRSQGVVQAYTVKLVSSPEEKEKSWKQRGEILGVKTAAGWRKASGLINLYWPKQEIQHGLDYGDILLVNGAPREVEPPRNPKEFDLKRFLAAKNIFHTHFLRIGNWAMLQRSGDAGFHYHAHKARMWSIAAIKRFVTSPQEQGIVVALVLGVTDGIDDDLQSAYAASGAMHVLAVSGLHVSIIYGLILFFFKPMNRSGAGRWTLALISLALLWFYAFLTGLSPSVLRAVTMFSFVVMAKPIGKHTNIYNTLAASAFFLLLYDPMLITSVGFQLSYLAVLGIVYLQRPLSNLWLPPNAILHWAWQLSCVSIAAQIATVALGLFYFHQFPVYFLLSNLFVIPGSFVVLIAGIVLLVISPFELPASWLGFLLERFVEILNEGIFLIERLPASLVGEVFISETQSILLIMMIIFLLLLFHYRKFTFLLLSFGCMAFFSVLSWLHFFTDIEQPSFTVYHIPGHSAMEWFGNGRSLFVADSSLEKSRSNTGYHISPNRLFRGVSSTSVTAHPGFTEVHGLRFWRWRNKTFLWIWSESHDLLVSPVWDLALKDHGIDYIIVSNNAVRSLPELASRIGFTRLIFDSSNSKWYQEKLSKNPAELSQRCHWVLKDGAFTVTL